MSNLIILDGFNDCTLRVESDPVEDFSSGPFDSGEFEATTIGRILVDFMYDTPNAVGIAAPQLGIFKRAFALRGRFSGRPCVFFNPYFIIRSDQKDSFIEGCLSIPRKDFLVSRYVDVSKLVWQNMYGRWEILENPEERTAQEFQHEWDHLYGKTLFDTGVEV